MKKFTTLMLTLLFAVAFSATVFASSCPRLVKQIDNKMASMSMPMDKTAQVKALRDEGEKLHKAGKHAESVATLKKALDMMEKM